VRAWTRGSRLTTWRIEIYVDCQSDYSGDQFPEDITWKEGGVWYGLRAGGRLGFSAYSERGGYGSCSDRGDAECPGLQDG